MAKKRGPHKLNVFLNALPVGALEYKIQKNLTFKYSLEWLGRANAFPISRSLPLTELTYEGAPVFAYFDNLLPDAVSIRQRIAARMRAESDQVFDLLAVVGRDCVGALQFMKEEDGNPRLEEAKGLPISESEIAEKLRNLSSVPLAASDEESFRLSIAGAQEKTAFLNFNKSWHVPQDATPTTHIFKPQLGDLKPGLSFRDSVENEWLCAQIVREFGMSVAECEIAQFEDIRVLIVKRFDRQWNGNRLIRIPQEDMCQALSVPNFKKYESEGGPGVVDIMDLLIESNSPDEDRRAFMKSLVIFHLLGATDGHAKNYSIAWGPLGFQMTPLYDILSAQPLTDRGRFSTEKLKLAMAIGDKTRVRIRDIYRRHFHQTAKACRMAITEIDSIIDETLDQMPQVIDRVSSQLKEDFPSEIAKSIFDGMNSRSQQLSKTK